MFFFFFFFFFFFDDDDDDDDDDFDDEERQAIEVAKLEAELNALKVDAKKVRGVFARLDVRFRDSYYEREFERERERDLTSSSSSSFTSFLSRRMVFSAFFFVISFSLSIVVYVVDEPLVLF